MDETKAAIGMKVRHMGWPKDVYGTIVRLTDKSFGLAVEFSPQEEGKEYTDGGDLRSLRNFDIVE